jgi:tRNA-specific 2-thiouridylase
MSVPEQLLAHLREVIGIDGDPASIRVVCAMSGGVDSAVAAALVKAAGYDAVGITLQLYDHGEAVRRKGACCAGQDIHDARRVAGQLEIPHYVLDFESRFRQAVIEDFVESYAAGETPVPCIRCNQTVKFTDLVARAGGLGAAALVTGHYVESRDRGDGSGHRDLLTPADMTRDQSYFLFATTQDQLDYLRFPLGSLSKSETRKIAAELNLGIATKPDSQDICFVPDGHYAGVITRLKPEAAQPGEIADENGQVLGRHDGIIHFTIGQRRGLGIAAAEPLYVVGIEPEARRVVVGPRSSLLRKALRLTSFNWLSDKRLEGDSIPVFAKVRSTRAPVGAELSICEGRPMVRIPDGEYAISPGQACVFYDRPGAGARVLGGGFIAKEAIARQPALRTATSPATL